MELNCSINGDKRFHPAYTKVKLDDTYEGTIREVLTFSKRIQKDGKVTTPLTFEESKKYPVVGFVWGTTLFPTSMYRHLVELLWYSYLKTNPKLVDELETYTEFNDFGDIDDEISHAALIKRFLEIKENKDPLVLKMPEAGECLYDDFKPLLDVVYRRENIMIEDSLPLEEGTPEVLVYFQQLEEVVESGAPVFPRSFYEKVYKEYAKLINRTPEALIGGAFIRKNKKTKKHLAFLGLIEDHNLQSFRRALESLKSECVSKRLAIGMQMHLGCYETSGPRWEERYAILKEVFSDYYVILYKES